MDVVEVRSWPWGQELSRACRADLHSEPRCLASLMDQNFSPMPSTRGDWESMLEHRVVLDGRRVLIGLIKGRWPQETHLNLTLKSDTFKFTMRINFPIGGLWRSMERMSNIIKGDIFNKSSLKPNVARNVIFVFMLI